MSEKLSYIVMCHTSISLRTFYALPVFKWWYFFKGPKRKMKKTFHVRQTAVYVTILLANFLNETCSSIPHRRPGLSAGPQEVLLWNNCVVGTYGKTTDLCVPRGERQQFESKHAEDSGAALKQQIKNNWTLPWPGGSAGWSMSPQSGHTPELWVQSPVRARTRGNWSMFFSLTLMLISPP